MVLFTRNAFFDAFRIAQVNKDAREMSQQEREVHTAGAHCYGGDSREFVHDILGIKELREATDSPGPRIIRMNADSLWRDLRPLLK